MAARKKLYHDQSTIERIQASQLINRLNDNALGKLQVEMTPGQIKSAEILLRKVVPDLSSTNHTGEINHNYVAQVPVVAPELDSWQRQHSAPTLQ